MTALRLIGVDPGPIPGIVVLDCNTERGSVEAADALQCTHRIAPGLFATLLHGSAGAALVQVEQFVIGARSGRLSNAHDASITRELVGRFTAECARIGVPCLLRSAAQVKPWATEARLAKARLLEPTKGMRHARDAARHALFAAVHDGGLPDPLSRRWAS